MNLESSINRQLTTNHKLDEINITKTSLRSGLITIKQTMDEIINLIQNYKAVHPIRYFAFSVTFWTGIALFAMYLAWKLHTSRKYKSNETDQLIEKKDKDLIKEKAVKTEREIIKKVVNSFPLKSGHSDNQPITEIPQSTENEKKPPSIIYSFDELKGVIEEKSKITPNPEALKPKIQPRKKEELPESILETFKEIKANLSVNYHCNIQERKDHYPILRLPGYGTVIRSHRIGSTKRRGFKDEEFQKAIEELFGSDFTVLGNARMNTGKNTRPFEPDIALISKNTKINLRIDIEIDEPYAGITRQATHCKGEDLHRDTYFTDRGWVVIRFSEFQVHTQEILCLKYIAQIVKAIDTEYSIPAQCRIYDNVNSEPAWDIVQAQKWEKQKYREQYLNHEFSALPEIRETIERDLNAQELEEEKQVKPTLLGVSENNAAKGFNEKNIHPRDKRIKFYPEPHIYTIDGRPIPSVSTMVNRFFPEFDMNYWSERKSYELGMTASDVAIMWKNKGEKAASQGTFLHQQIENYFLGLDHVEVPEMALFRKFNGEHQTIKPFRTEWRVFDEQAGFAGTIDLIAQNGSGFEIYDWKRSKKIVGIMGKPNTLNSYQTGIGFLNHIDDTSYNRYCIQQNLYKHILEKNYDLTISAMYLVVLHPVYDQYYKFKVPLMKNEVMSIVKTLDI